MNQQGSHCEGEASPLSLQGIPDPLTSVITMFHDNKMNVNARSNQFLPPPKSVHPKELFSRAYPILEATLPCS